MIFIDKIKQFLSRPYLMYEYDTKRKIYAILFIVIFSATFIYIYKPFDLNHLTEHEIQILLWVHGLVNLLILISFFFILPLTFGGYFKEENRTIFRHILAGMILFISASETHRYVNHYFGELPFHTFKDSVVLTLGIGIFPPFFLFSACCSENERGGFKTKY